MELLVILYGLGCIAAALLVAALLWAPMKLYQIARELRAQNDIMREQTEIMRDHTRLLASIANAVEPIDAARK